MDKKCMNCGARILAPYGDGLECPATQKKLLTSDQLWSKIQMGGKPSACNEWYSKEEIGEDSK